MLNIYIKSNNFPEVKCYLKTKKILMKKKKIS